MASKFMQGSGSISCFSAETEHLLINPQQVCKPEDVLNKDCTLIQVITGSHPNLGRKLNNREVML